MPGSVWQHEEQRSDARLCEVLTFTHLSPGEDLLQRHMIRTVLPPALLQTHVQQFD